MPNTLQDPALERIKEAARKAKPTSRPAVESPILRGADKIQQKAIDQRREVLRSLGVVQPDGEDAKSGDALRTAIPFSIKRPLFTPPDPKLVIDMTPEEREEWYWKGVEQEKQDIYQMDQLNRYLKVTSGGGLGLLFGGPVGAAIGAGSGLAENALTSPATTSSQLKADFGSLAVSSALAPFGAGLGTKLANVARVGAQTAKGATTFGRIARGTIITQGAVVPSAAAGGAVRAYYEDRPVLRGAAQSAALASTLSAMVSAGIPAGFAAIGRASKSFEEAIAKRAPLITTYKVLEDEARTVTMSGNPWGLSPDKLDRSRQLAFKIGMPPRMYGQFLDELAVDHAAYPETWEHTTDRVLETFIKRMNLEMPAPVDTLKGALQAELGTLNLPPGLDEIHLFPKWVREGLTKAAARVGIHSAASHQMARKLMSEHYGARVHASMQASRTFLSQAFRDMGDEEAERIGLAMHGSIRKGKITPPVKPVFDPELPPDEARARFTRAVGVDVAKDGPLSAEEFLRAVRGDPKLSQPGKAAAILWHRLRLEMEEEIAESGLGHVWSKGLWRNRAWMTKEMVDAAKKDPNAMRIMDPVAFGMKGAAKLERDVAILELDQRQGGAWWVRNKDDEIIGRFTDPNEAGRFAARSTQAGEKAVVQQPMLLREAMDGVKDLGQLAVYPGVTDARRYMELANDITLNRTFRAIAETPLLSADAIPPGEIASAWSKIPDDTRLYGDLAGKFIRSNVAQHVHDMLAGHPGFWDALLRGWSFSRLVMNPATSMRNMYSDVFLADHPATGMGPFSSIRNVADFARSYGERDEIYRWLVKNGGLGGEFTKIVNRIYREKLEDLSARNQPVMGFFDQIKEGLSLNSDHYAAQDQIFAGGSFLKLLRDGHSPESALSRLKEVWPDFRLMPKAVPFTGGKIPIGKYPMNPFIKFDVEMLRSFNNALKYGPVGWLWFAKWYGLYPMAATAASLQMTGMSLDEWSEMQRYRPKWRASDLHGVLLPWLLNGEGGKKIPHSLDISSSLPMADVGQRTDIRLNEIADLDDVAWPYKVPLHAASRIFSHPVNSALFALSSGINPMSGQPVSGPGQDEIEARGKAVSDNLFPFPLYMPGFYYDKLWRSALDQVPEGGRIPRPRTLGEVIPQLYLGLKVRRVDPDLETDLFDQGIKGRLVKVREDLRKLNIDRTNNRISEGQFRESEGRLIHRMLELEALSARGKPILMEQLFGTKKEK